VGFHRNKFTSLPEVQDRILGTSITATWTFSDTAITGTATDFNQVAFLIEKQLVNTFAGPSDVGVFSASVQQTLYDMGKSAVLNVPAIDSIRLEMPNIHNIPFSLEQYGFPKEQGSPNIFFPIDEPHGMIAAEIHRSKLTIKSRL
jgi:urate oxidase